MEFKVQKLGTDALLIRGYQKEEDTKYCFVCNFYRNKKEEKWQAIGAMTSGNAKLKDIKEAYKFIENFPEGVYSYVSPEDFKRFYKRRYFTCIDFTKRKE